MHIALEILGEPIPWKASTVTFNKKTGKRYGFRPKNRVEHQEIVRLAWEQAGRPQFPPMTTLGMVAIFFLGKPLSLPRSRLWPVTKPDCTNLLKQVEDGLKGFAFDEDSRIIEVRTAKRYVKYPSVARTVILLYDEAEASRSSEPWELSALLGGTLASLLAPLLSASEPPPSAAPAPRPSSPAQLPL